LNQIWQRKSRHICVTITRVSNCVLLFLPNRFQVEHSPELDPPRDMRPRKPHRCCAIQVALKATVQVALKGCALIDCIGCAERDCIVCARRYRLRSKRLSGDLTHSGDLAQSADLARHRRARSRFRTSIVFIFEAVNIFLHCSLVARSQRLASGVCPHAMSPPAYWRWRERREREGERETVR